MPILWWGLILSAPSGAVVPRFTDVTAEAGLLASHGVVPEDLPMNGSTPDFYVASAAVTDYDKDGWPDLYVTRHNAPDRLYRNNGDGTFTDILPGTGLEVARHANGTAWADFDNDGDADVFMNSLLADRHAYFLNDGSGHFTEAGVSDGAAIPVDGLHHGMSVTFGDVDRDGWLDLFTTEWGIDLADADPALHMVLLVNRGEEAPGHFENATRSAGLVIEGTRLPGEQHGFSAYLSDFDGDGWPDLGMVADFGNSQFFWNRGSGRFMEATDSARVGTDQNGMGGAVGDFDNDGDLDWFVTSIDGTFSDGLDGNRLYRNVGGRRFRDVTDEAGVRNGGWAWGAAFFDPDNDGDLDLVQTNGFLPGEPLPPDDPFSDRTVLWLNDGTGRFTEAGEEAGIVDRARGQAVVVFDYDRDGDEDLFITNSYHTPVLYRNDTASGNNWLRVALEGTVSNRDAVGARVVVTAEEGGISQLRELSPANGYLSQHESVLHFGIGRHTGPVDEVRIRWPSGIETVLNDVATKRVLRVTEVDDGSQEAPMVVVPPQPQSVMRDERAVLTVEAAGNPDPVFQWYRDGELVPDATQPSLVIERMRPFDDARYSVEVSNPHGTIRTDPVRLAYVPSPTQHSVARQWNEVLLDAIRVDYPDPTVHSRNLFHVSAAMWDAWVAYDHDGTGVPYLYAETAMAEDRAAARKEAISYAAYRILSSRYQLSPNHEYSQADFDARMDELGYDPSVLTLLGESPAALGNRIAARYLSYGWRDGANEAGAYADTTGYVPVNEPMIFTLPGAEVVDPNRWQPLAFDFLVLQNGIPVGAAIQDFLGLSWGHVAPFALEPADNGLPVDPGPPPLLGTETDAAFKAGALEVIRYSSVLDPASTETIDISPSAYYNNPVGTNDGTGYPENPYTGEPYEPNVVRLADYGRCIAEFWADGPDSETPPGHWNTIANAVSELLAEKRVRGTGPVLDDLAWDVHLYFALNGALHDAAIAAWGAKRFYDYVRPVTMIRHMAGMGQSSDPDGPSYHPEGLPLEPGLVEVITDESSSPGGRHEHLAGHVGRIALRCWQGEPEDPQTGVGGVGWILGESWMPYQRFSFVTPPFAAYVSGHSTFSRAGAEVLAAMTGSEYFPGGLMTYTFSKDTFLHFERGPSEDLTLTWATYYDAADEAGLSRLYGGIHVRADDFEGRVMGSEVGKTAWRRAAGYFEERAEKLSWEIPYSELTKAVGSLESPMVKVDIGDGSDRLLRMELPSGIPEDVRFRLDTSADLQEWSTVSFEEALRALEFLDHGRVEAVLDTDLADAPGAFFRLRLESAAGGP